MLLTSALLQRIRLTDPTAGLWEAADVQWWWRRARTSHQVPQVVWVDSQLKIGFVDEQVGALYQRLGFRVGWTDTTFETTLPG
jgi:hypothetical protein